MNTSEATLLYVDFPFTGPWGAQLAQALEPLARQIAATPGLRWKLWTENPAEGRAGGVYLFADEASARAYLQEHTQRLRGFGIDGIRADFRALNAPLNRLTAAALPAG